MPYMYLYKLISPTTNWYDSGRPLRGSGARGKSTSTWLTLKVGKPRADVICTGPRSNDVMKYGEEKRREKQKKGTLIWSLFLRSRVTKLYWPISSTPESRTSTPPYLHSQTDPASNVPSSSTLVVQISAWFLVGIIRMVELPLMTRHRWELPLPASFIAIGDGQSYTSIVYSHLICRHLKRKLL